MAIRFAYNSLAAKLILSVGAVMAVLGISFTFVIYSYEKDKTLNDLAAQGQFASELVLHSFQSAMMSNRHDEIQKIFFELGKAKDIRRIRISDMHDKAIFASRPEETGNVYRASDAENVMQNGEIKYTDIIDNDGGEQVMRVYSAVKNPPACSTAQCHFHAPETPELGIILVEIAAGKAMGSLRKSLAGTVAFGIFFTALVSTALFFILYNVVTKPMARLEEGMRRLARGDFDHPIAVSSKSDEIALLAETSNAMAVDIRQYKNRLEDWNNALQAEIERKTLEITEAHEHLIGAEKLASLGRMAAGVAHELNSPLTGVLTFAHLLRQRTPPDRKQDAQDLDLIIEQTNRCSKIIKELLGFSRKGISDEKVRVNINDLLDKTVSMVKNQARFHNVEIMIEPGGNLPDILVDTNQLQQVALNIITNAVDAMNNRGSVTIRTRMTAYQDADGVLIEIEDTGPGILPDHLGKIFEPFFTTKPIGKGTGLGLPVSYGIIKRHGGDITVRSTVGKGTVFTIMLPGAGAKGPAASIPTEGTK